MKGLSLSNKPSRIEGHARPLFSSIDSSVPTGNLDTTICYRTGAFYGGAAGTTDKLFSCEEQCDE
jgi:hypothetical protein